MVALSWLGAQMGKISNILQSMNEFHTKVSTAMETRHRAAGENANNNEILKADIQDASLTVDC